MNPTHEHHDTDGTLGTHGTDRSDRAATTDGTGTGTGREGSTASTALRADPRQAEVPRARERREDRQG